MVDRFSELRNPWGAAGLAMALVLTTGACATYTGARYGGPDAPLRARLASTFELSSRSPSLHFAVSDRAHVALFRISSNGYTRALYPYHPSGPSRFGAGPHTVFSSSLALDRNAFGSRFRFGAPLGYRSAAFHGVGRSRLSFVMLVASRRPLRLDRIRHDVPFRFRRARFLASPLQGGSAFGTMDRLLARLIPAGLSNDDWAVDWVYTSVGAPRPAPLPRHLAVAQGPDPDADTTQSADEDRQPRLLDPGDLPFDPPHVPVDLPEVEPSDRGEVAERRDPDVTEHFGRLFDDGRREAEGWIPGAGRRGHGYRERDGREWTEALEAWARNPEAHAFPDPPRPPDRWNGPHRWRRPGSARFPGRTRGGDGDRIRAPGVSAPRRPRVGEIEVDRPTSTEVDGGSGRRSSGGDDDGGDGGTRHP